MYIGDILWELICLAFIVRRVGLILVAEWSQNRKTRACGVRFSVVFLGLGLVA